MLPDFSAPAFAFVALCTARFRTRIVGDAARQFSSDYRCQLRDPDAPPESNHEDVRVYLVGRETAQAEEDVPVLIVFLDREGAASRCRVGTTFELREWLDRDR